VAADYDPRAKGAKCDVCPLGGCKVVPPEYGHGLTLDVLRSGKAIAIIGEAPGDEEERVGRPFVGKSGEELDRTMHLAGLRRKDVMINSVLLCKPPKGRLRDLLTLIAKENKQKDKEYKEACKAAELMGYNKPAAPEHKLSPIDCCKPRFMAEIADFSQFITLGGTATHAITGTNASIMAIRGGIMEMEGTDRSWARKVMPTIHPSFALRQPKFLHVLRNDFFKAVRWFRGIAVWQPPELVWHPTPQQIREYLQTRKGRILAYDLETDGIEVLTAKIRCLSIGDETTALAIATLGKDGVTKFYSPEDEKEVISILKEYFEDPQEIKYGWNIITYDAPVLLHQWGIVVRNQMDGILLHKSAESEMPHGLGYVGSLYTEAPSWKCYDEFTEVLTPEGWVAFVGLDRGVQVAQWDNGEITFVEPRAYVDQSYVGKMWKLENEATDLLVSPDHKMVYRTDSGELRTVEVQNLPGVGYLPHGGDAWSDLATLKRSLVPYEGRIYCVSVPSGFILVRRNSKITVSGNTDRETGMKLAFGAESDEDLLKYCAMDVNVTYKVLNPVFELVRLRDQVPVYKFDSKVQEVCAAMKEVGMYVDQNKRLYFEKKMLKRRHELLKMIRDGLSIDNFNPGSVHKVRDLLFERWKIEVPLDDKERFTGSGDASTSDLVLRTVLTDRTVPKEQRDMIKLIRYYRKIQKTLGTYVTKLRFNNVAIDSDLNWDDEDEEWADREAREKYGLVKTGIVHPYTNRMYPGYSATAPVTGRISSSKPLNAMNFPKVLRGMITCQPGNVLVGADSEQIEVRVAAAWWKIEKYLLAFREKKDVHSMSTYMVFGEAFCKVAGIDERYFHEPGMLVGKAYNDQGTFIGKGESSNLRKLGKIVHLSCIAAHEPVVVLDERREVPISQLKPGDWVWSWSLQRNRYEPTRVVKAWVTGIRKCIKINLAKGNGDRWESSITLTPDHPVLSRDGTFKHAGDLCVDDRIMPFFRSDSETGRATLSPFNDDQRIGEARVVAGLYNTDPNYHAHHIDENPSNNVPDNIELLTPGEHYKEHEAERKATRLAPNSNWHKAMKSVPTRYNKSEAGVKVWAQRKERNPDAGKGRHGSVLDAFVDIIGVYSDEAVAKEAGCTRALVGLYRKEFGIAPPVVQRGGLKHLLLNNPQWRRLFFTLSNDHIADLVNLEYGTTYTRQAVKAVRDLLNEPVVEKEKKYKPSKLDAFTEIVGHELDSIVAEKAGVSDTAVRLYRQSRGIPAYWLMGTNKPTNHRVVSVEDESEYEVWDIEVEHEDHNFALACGIFVHNSQYMAGSEQVHKIIQSTEVPAQGPDGKDLDDGTTDLPYALMPLARVREMHEKWLAGAPEYKVGWERDVNLFKRQGYLREPINGRRRDFLDSLHGTPDDLAANEIVNFCIQSAAAALISNAMIQVYEQIPKNKWGPGTGLINQCHDHLVVECPESEAKWVCGVIEEAMNHTHPALPGVKFAATAEIGKSWDKV
jgi:DNA polymerase I-like protein with 3'-5' exonuclease and polymerase domains/uracil-DNA glycosylase